MLLTTCQHLLKSPNWTTLLQPRSWTIWNPCHARQSDRAGRTRGTSQRTSLSGAPSRPWQRHQTWHSVGLNKWSIELTRLSQRSVAVSHSIIHIAVSYGNSTVMMTIAMTSSHRQPGEPLCTDFGKCTPNKLPPLTCAYCARYCKIIIEIEVPRRDLRVAYETSSAKWRDEPADGCYAR